MRITAHLFEAFLKCPTKCWLQGTNETPTGNTYAEWVKIHNESYRATASKRLLAKVSLADTDLSPRPDDLKAAKWRFAVDVAVTVPYPPRGSQRPAANPLSVQPETLNSPPSSRNRATSSAQAQKGAVQTAFTAETHLHAAECVPAEGRGKTDRITPIRFTFTNKLTKDDRLLLAFDAFVFSAALGRKIDVGKIMHGDGYATRRVKTATLNIELRRHLKRIAALLTNPTPPDLVLNQHCAECEFKDRCRREALEKDDLSLLARMSEKERTKLRSRGIFTVTQLSYTFRPRRRPKRLRDKQEKYHHSLKALAIREKKIHIVGSPELKLEGTPVYLDVEGLPDRNFYYLIGVRTVNGKSVVQHSLWADTVEDEGKIWREFLGILETIEKPVLIHYGSYETTFLKRVGERYGKPAESSAAAEGLASPVNLLSVIFAQIYFPAYSNGLKDIARFLGFTWDDVDSSGLNSVAWRHRWEETHDETTKAKLLTYNAQDCEALNLATDRAGQLVGQLTAESPPQAGETDVVYTDAKEFQRKSNWRAFTSPISGFEDMNTAAHWDYHRNRVYARTDKTPKKPLPRHPRKQGPLQEQLTVVWPTSRSCPKCQSKSRSKATKKSRTVHDIIFGKHSLKRRVVKYVFSTYRCRKCGVDFGIEDKCLVFRKYGWNLVAYVFYDLVELNIPQITVVRHFNRLFGFELSRSTFYNMKVKVAEYYAETKQKILDRIVRGGLVHADETRANIKGRTGFVWVLTTNTEVVYIFADSREAEIIQELLADFKGILVSDFYTAYDSVGCAHQRCLIHLMRDLNDSVLSNPFDTELKQVVTAFADILKPMVETVDRFGLKTHFLKKHLVQVDRFYRALDKAEYQSEETTKCKDRFERNRDKLFTFLSHDGVPWHNNNAEHAIKAFARLRDVIRGTSTEKGLEEYLTLLSVCQTCKYTGVDFLDFLRSGEKDINAFAESRRGRRRRSSLGKPKA